MTEKLSKKKNVYYKAITFCLEKSDVELIENAITQISFEQKRNVPISHFLRFLIRNYSDDAKYKYIKENITKS